MNLPTERRVFRYRRMASAFGAIWLLIALLPISFCLLERAWPNFFGFAVLTILLSFAVANFLKAAFEKIILEDGKLTWISQFGKVKATIPVSAIRPESFLSRPGLSTVYQLKSGDQTIWFRGGLDDQGWLLNLILETAYGAGSPPPPAPEVTPAVGTYKYGGIYLFMPVLWVFNAAMATFNGLFQLHSKFGGPAVAFITGFGLIACLLNVVIWARFLFERIDVSDSRLIWKNWRGLKLDVSFDEFIPGTMTWMGMGSGAKYKIQTTKGELVWSSQMKNSAALSFFLRDVAKQPFLPIPHGQMPLYPPSPDYSSAQPIA